MCLGAGGLVGLEFNGSVSKLPFTLVNTAQLLLDPVDFERNPYSTRFGRKYSL